MKKIIIMEPANIAEDFFIGNSHIQIADDYCISMNEAERSIERICERAYPRLPASAFENELKAINTINVI